VPGDIAREKQAELAAQLATIQAQRAKLTRTSAEHEAVIRDATALLPHCGEAYRRGDDNLRRDYNQAWFEQILVDSEQGQTKVTSVTRTELFEALRQAAVQAPGPGEPRTELKPGRAQVGEAIRSANPFERVLTVGTDEADKRGEGDRGLEHEQPGRFRARVVHRVGGSNVALLVELRGLEPLTPTLPGRGQDVSRCPPTFICAGQRCSPIAGGRRRTSTD
jgi:hypothetical protein